MSDRPNIDRIKAWVEKRSALIRTEYTNLSPLEIDAIEFELNATVTALAYEVTPLLAYIEALEAERDIMRDSSRRDE